MLTKLFLLKNSELIKEFTLEIMDTLNTNNLYIKSVYPNEKLAKDINEELQDYSLPTFSNFLVFKRKNYFHPHPNKTHIDYSNGLDQFIKASIVIPVEGYHNTFMYWMEGDYTTDTTFLEDGISGKIIKWKEEPKLLYKEEIIQPTLCRVDVPHDACSRIDGKYRTVVTIRLSGNPSFEDIVKRRFR